MLRLTKWSPYGKAIRNTFYTRDYKYEIKRSRNGWTVNKKNVYGEYVYSFPCRTFNEAKESLACRYI